eukprot:CAMPEP_0169449950 /NCGR_PEP_ID=MMETSP1042-20121227/12895_1 /TAXON_ID=464988 /ORGANISM="Hemiselmis andersenii, Strain CCMP1180" /LENGTH=90 /DNA_ID=CAMNT_0009561745 /DNA_START=231 /DNA_END=501 /DNA_ORIENTATION=-
MAIGLSVTSASHHSPDNVPPAPTLDGPPPLPRSQPHHRLRRPGVEQSNDVAIDGEDIWVLPTPVAAPPIRLHHTRDRLVLPNTSHKSSEV